MPFNGQGVFQRLYNWVQDRDNSVNILASRVDEETDGMVDAINGITAQNVPFRSPIRSVDGTAALPGVAFDGQTGAGLYRQSNVVGVSTEGVSRLTLSSTGAAFTPEVQLNGGGTSTTPALTDSSTSVATTEFVQDLRVAVKRSFVTQTGDVTSSTPAFVAGPEITFTADRTDTVLCVHGFVALTIVGTTGAGSDAAGTYQLSRFDGSSFVAAANLPVQANNFDSTSLVRVVQPVMVQLGAAQKVSGDWRIRLEIASPNSTNVTINSASLELIEYAT